MAKEVNNRCPLQAECENVCKWQGSELDCDYYHSFARPGYEIDDQETIRFKRIDEAMMAAYEADDEDEEEYVESPSDAENAAVSPVEVADEVSILPVSVHLDGSNGVTEKIKRAMYDAAKQFVYIGFLLWEVQEFCYYSEKGYSSVYEYAEAELGFKKSSTKNFIAINYEFGCRDDRPRGIAHQRTMSLQPAYSKFSYSQLCEMLSMSEKQRAKVTPDMTVRQIRDLKRGEVEQDLPPDMETIPIQLPDDPASEPGQTSGQQYRSCTVNNIWKDLPSDLLKSLTMFSGIRYNPKSCYDITIKLHKDF